MMCTCIKALLAAVGGVAVAAGIICFLPAVKGPIYETQQSISEKLNDKYIVANYKKKIQDITESKAKIAKNIRQLEIRKRQLAYEGQKLVTKENQIKQSMHYYATNNNIPAFNALKKSLEYTTKSVQHINQSITTIDENIKVMAKTVDNINLKLTEYSTTLEAIKSQKEIVQSIEAANNIIEEINGLKVISDGDVDVGGAMSRLEESYRNEVIRSQVINSEIEANTQGETPVIQTQEEALAYLNGISQ